MERPPGPQARPARAPAERPSPGRGVGKNAPPPTSAPWRLALYDVIFEAETPSGRAFDIALLAAIVCSVFAVLLESVPEVRREHGTILRAAEWAFTGLFTVEYGLRLVSVRSPLRYAASFFGLVDLLAIVPTYLSLFVAGAQSLTVIRALRLLRVFRVLKLTHFVGEAALLRSALRASGPKIVVFLGTVVTLVVCIGALMYLIEGEANGFTSIPTGIYWAIVTLTTVGYGDIAPGTTLGKILASVVMVLGYGIIAVPTGIVTVELAGVQRAAGGRGPCPACAARGHDADAVFCKYCGRRLRPDADADESRPPATSGA